MPVQNSTHRRPNRSAISPPKAAPMVGTSQRRRRHHALHQRGQRELVFEEGQGARNHAGIVAEQKAAKGDDERNDGETHFGAPFVFLLGSRAVLG